MMLLVTWGKSLLFSGSQFSPVTNGIIIPVLGKFGSLSAQGESCSHKKKRLKDEVNGGGARNSRELRGAYGLHGNARQPGEEAGLGNRLPQGLKLKVSQRKLPSPRRQAFSETELCTRTGLCVECTLLFASCYRHGEQVHREVESLQQVTGRAGIPDL